MQNVLFCFTVDDVCYDGYSTKDHLEQLLSFCNEVGMMATFFVVPLAHGKNLKERSGYIDLLKQAISNGHEIAQHGLKHDRFECGIPPGIILALPHEGPARERLKKSRKEIEESLQIECLRKRLSRGREIIEEGIGQKIKGFRAPCLSTCENLFHALYAEKYLYDSSKFLQEAGWNILNNKVCIPQPITREIFDSLQDTGTLQILPLTTEYTWYLTKEKFQIGLDLAKHDFNACMESGIPFVPLSHVSPIQEGEDNCGFELYRRLIDYARKRSSNFGLELQVLTLSQTCERENYGRK